MSHTASTITIQSGVFSNYTMSANYGFFVQNHINTLTQNGEWMYDASTKKIRMYSNTGSPSNVKAAIVDKLVNINSKNYVTIDGLKIDGSNTETIYNINSTYLKIQNCEVKNAGTVGINVNNT